MEATASSPTASLPEVRLLGVRLHAVTEAQAIEHLLDENEAGRGGIVVTPNIDHTRRAVNHPEYGALVERAELAVADGMPLIWASRLAGTPLPEQVAGSNLIFTLSEAAARRGRSIFLLGGVEGTAEGAAEILTARYPGLRVAGTYCPPFGFEKDAAEMARLRASVLGAAPDIVFVGLGSPKQENLAELLRPELPAAWWLGVGVSFSFVTGDVSRAPRWMQRLGIEWVHRLCSEPRRLARRYLLEGIPFALRLMCWAVGRRLRGGRGRAPAEARS